jgi:hypothetical protein
MGHELAPESGRFLPLAEVLARLEREFRIVEVSQEQAQEQIDRMLQYGDQLAARGVQESLAVSTDLRKVRDSSVMVGLADKKRYGKACLRFLLKPDRVIFIDYEDGHHEDASKPLLKRVAATLGYRITVV